MSLFPTTQRPKHLVQFNAGKCVREGNIVKPDLRKGVVYMDQSDDQLMHFYWKERKSTEPEEDLIIFPDEAEFIRVNECTTGRVYLMKFKSSNQKLFFWMQSKNEDKDEELASRVNLLINDPQAAIMGDSAGSSRMPGIDYGASSPADMMHLLGGSGKTLPPLPPPKEKSAIDGKGEQIVSPARTFCSFFRQQAGLG
ncbi:proteasome complex subunit Rpn13 ubiquitin receptor-domain-containing protein [Dichotomocladium elegans]|nr:proteasome complex subunit Rpn13 ubiquitin receptor-domain-containing protein [Dichotomocladium elegans]